MQEFFIKEGCDEVLGVWVFVSVQLVVCGMVLKVFLGVWQEVFGVEVVIEVQMVEMSGVIVLGFGNVKFW